MIFLPAMQELRCVLGVALTKSPILLETVEDYSSDAFTGHLTADRLLGFAQGLYVAGLIDLEGFCDVDVAVCKAAGLEVHL